MSNQITVNHMNNNQNKMYIQYQFNKAFTLYQKHKKLHTRRKKNNNNQDKAALITTVKCNILMRNMKL